MSAHLNDTTGYGMNRYVRWVLIGFCLGQLVLAVAYFFKMRWATQLWPLNYTNEMSYIFIASIFAAAGAATLWSLLSKEYGALLGISLDYVALLSPTLIFCLQLYSRSDSSKMRNFIVALIITIFVGLVGIWWSRRIPIRDVRPMPPLVRGSFIGFSIVLVILGTALILKTRNILPWSITVESSVIYGWYFIGAACYFMYGALRPSWGNAIGQLIGFLAYDLVLIVPFIARIPTIEENLRLNLYLYIGVLIYSGTLAIYYLFINTATRLVLNPGNRLVTQPLPEM